MANPPVCKIGNYGKLKYEQDKKNKENKKRVQETKTLKIRPVTQEHDLDIEVRRAKEFLARGDKVKIECFFRRREAQYPELGKRNIEYILSKLTDVCKIEKNCEMVVRSMIAIIAPK